MNNIMVEAYPLFQLYQSLRSQLMEILSDEDLDFRPSGDNPSLGQLCRELGEVEQAYIHSFKEFNIDFSYRNDEPGLETSVRRLSAWFKQLDGQLEAALKALTDEDISLRRIDRGGNFKVSPRVQLEIYKEALLIFYGKVDVYLKALGKIRPEQWQDWIG